MSDAVLITAMICATVLAVFWMSLGANKEEDDEIDG